MHSILKPAVLLVSLGVALSAYPQTKAVNRITQAIDDRETIQLRGTVHPMLQRGSDQGRMDGGMRLEGVSLVFKRTAAQDAAAEKLAAEQQDSSSPNYHKWLTPEQYADRFGLTTDDLNKVVAWLQAQGFTVNRVTRGRDQVFFTGTVSQIETIFRTEMHRYQVDSEPHFAMAVEPAIPAALSEVVLGLHNVSNFRPKARVRHRKISATEVQSHYTNSTAQHFLVPDDFATIYDVQSLYSPGGLDGTGQTIAIIGQSQINTSDIDSFRAAGAANLPPRTAANFVERQVPNSGSAVIVSGDVGESSLDLEWAEGVAPGVKEVFVFVGNSSNFSAFDSLLYAIDNNVAPIISSSYGNCEQNLPAAFQTQLQTETQKAAMLGITVVSASGDFGAADCDSSPGLPAQGGLGVDMPGSSPYVTSIGGTTFTGDASNPGNFWNATNNMTHNGSVKSYIAEGTWNDTALVNALSATGGGASLLFSKPSWQTGTGVPADGERDVPDVALAASPNHDGYLLCVNDPGGNGNPAVLPCTSGFGDTNGNLDVAGGTSFGAPAFAGIVAILLQKAGAPQGNLNPTLYALAASTPSAFHDITSGNNIVPCQVGTPDCTSGTYGYNAGTGYDLVTGLGTIDANVLITNWNAGNPTTADFTMFGDTVGIAAPGGSGTSTITIDARNGYSGTINFTCTAPTSAKIGCSVTGGPVILNGTTKSATITLSITTASAGLTPGSMPLWFTGSGAVFAGVLIFGVRAQRRRWAIAATLVALALLAAAVGCGGSSSSSGGGGTGTPAGNYTVTVTGTGTDANATTHTTSVIVAVL